MACQDCNFRKASCKHTKAICTEYDGTVNDDSTIKDVECKSIEETTQDLYDQIGALQSALNLGDLNSDCVELGDKKLKTILSAMLDTICALEGGSSTTNTTIDIQNMNLDFKCLVDPCGDSITTLKDLLQSLIDKVCEG